MINPFRRFYDAGYTALIPITPPDGEPSPRSVLAKRKGAMGKAPGQRNAAGQWSSFPWQDTVATEADMKRWAASGAGVGILCGDVIAVDVDTFDAALVARIERCAEIHLGHADARIGNSPKRVLVYRCDEPIGYRRLNFEGGAVELLTKGRQFVAHGIHPATRRPYAWPNGLRPFKDVTRVTPAQIAALFDDLAALLPAAEETIETAAADRAATNQEALTGRIDDIARAVRLLPNDGAFDSYDQFRNVGLAIKGATQQDPDAGLDMFQQWAARWTGGENDPEEVEAYWRSFKPPFGLGAQYLYKLAEEHAGTEQFDRALTLLTPEPDDDLDETAKPHAGAFNFVSFADALAQADVAAPPLVKGLMDKHSMAVLYGPSGAGKSFIAIDLGYHVATGKPFCGMKATASHVIYVAAEGGQGVRKRVKALQRKFGGDDAPAPGNFRFLLRDINFLQPKEAVAPFIEAVKQLNPAPGLIILDTLARMLPGDENSSVDMGALIKNVAAVIHRTGATVLLIHHSGKDAAKGARGWSGLRAATDTELEISDGYLSVTKQKDIDATWRTSYALQPVVLGLDSDGDPITSCTVLFGVDPGPTSTLPRLTETERGVLMAIDRLATANDIGDTVKFSVLLRVVQQDVSDKQSKASLSDVLKVLEGLRLIERRRVGRELFVRLVQPAGDCSVSDVFA